MFLGSQDREQFAGYESGLRQELEQYLTEHARRENYVVLTPPRVLFETDDDLSIGEFGIATRMAQPERPAATDGPAAQVEAGHTMIYRPRVQPTEAVSAEELGMERETVSISWNGQHRTVDKRKTLIGRSKDCDVQLTDPNVSRRHAELRQEGASYWIVDLGSTNGIEVNGRRLRRAKLEHGDRVTLGSTEIVFKRESP